MKTFKEFYTEQQQLITNGDTLSGLKDLQEVLNTLMKEILNGTKDNELIAIASILIDYSRQNKDEKMTSDAVKILELIANKHPSIKNISEYHYNLANGYFTLFDLHRIKNNNRVNLFTDGENYNKAKASFESALNVNPLFDSAIVNYGNLLDSSGRVFDAIQFYSKVKKSSESEPMAKGNLGMSIHYLSSIARNNRRDLLLLAKRHLEYATAEKNKEKILKIGGQYAYDSFASTLKTIQMQIANLPSEKKLHKQDTKYKNETLKNFIEEVIFDEDLFLNTYIFENKSKRSPIDNLFISMVLPEEDNATFYNLSKRINAVLESYVTARLVFSLSLYKCTDFDKLNKNTLYVNAGDGSMYNIYSGLLKTSFKEYFNVLDKIAVFLNDYLNLNIPDKSIDYDDFWFEDQNHKQPFKDKIVNDSNPQLFALYSTMLDIYKLGLAEMRNSLTHKDIEIYSQKGKTKLQSDEKINYSQLQGSTKQLASLVKRAIIYLIFYVNQKEKEKLVGKIIIKRYADTTPTLPDIKIK